MVFVTRRVTVITHYRQRSAHANGTFQCESESPIAPVLRELCDGQTFAGGKFSTGKFYETFVLFFRSARFLFLFFFHYFDTFLVFLFFFVRLRSFFVINNYTTVQRAHVYPRKFRRAEVFYYFFYFIRTWAATVCSIYAKCSVRAVLFYITPSSVSRFLWLRSYIVHRHYLGVSKTRPTVAHKIYNSSYYKIL